MALYDFPERFLRKIKITPNAELGTPCWIWTASHSTGKGQSYPQAHLDGKTRRVHRWVLERVLGRKIKPGHHVHHVCSNPSCVAEHHLEEVDPHTHAEIEAALGTIGDLSPDDVDQIRRRYARDPRAETLEAIAADFGQHAENIRKVATSRSFRRLPAVAVAMPAVLDLGQAF